MFRSLRPKKLEPLPLPFRDRRAEREAERRRRVERFANVELDRTPGFSWNRGRDPEPLANRLRRLLRGQVPALGFATLMGAVLVAGFLALARVGLMTPGPTIIYVENWSGQPDLAKPAQPDAGKGPDAPAE
ncbi:hypothetical protein [Thermaurantiacus sp.]